MDHERFDELARKVFDGTSRRRVLGGALASAVGAGVAAVTGLSAKGNKGKGKHRASANRKKRKGKKASAEFTCTAANANFQSCASVACAIDQDCFDVGCFNAGAPCNGATCANDAGNTDGSCPPGSCCASTGAGVANPSCVDVITQIAGAPGGLCGDVAGEGVCRSCPAGTKCAIDFVTGDVRCICSAASNCNGCCIDNGANGADDQCIANGNGQPVASPNPNFDGAFVCGAGGGQCEFCGTGLFNGCCTATGICSSGTTGNNCGNSGELCEVCINDAECGIDQTCTGGTTTTTASPTTTTTAAPCVAPKKACATATGTICCGKKRKCKNPGTANAKCKKKK